MMSKAKMPTREQLDRIADDMMGATEACDLARLDEIWSPDLRLWYNTTLETLSKEQAFGAISRLSADIEGLRFINAHRLYGDDGFVEQHDVTGRIDGKEFHVRTCIIVTVSDGRVSRIDEWWDSAQAPRKAGS